VIDCLIIDISDDGAKILSLSGHPLPNVFVLQTESYRVLGEAHVVWRSDSAVGVRLVRRQG
jgi:hypothetical protein